MPRQPSAGRVPPEKSASHRAAVASVERAASAPPTAAYGKLRGALRHTPQALPTRPNLAASHICETIRGVR